MSDRFVNGRPACPHCHDGRLIGSVDGPLRCSRCRETTDRTETHLDPPAGLALARQAITEARQRKTGATP